jgi:hypothetical protein
MGAPQKKPRPLGRGSKSLIAVKALKHLLREEKQETTDPKVYHLASNLA